MDDFIEIEEDDGDFDPEREDMIRGRWAMEGARTLAEAAGMLRRYAERLESLERAGWHLMRPVEDDCGPIHRPD